MPANFYYNQAIVPNFWLVHRLRRVNLLFCSHKTILWKAVGKNLHKYDRNQVWYWLLLIFKFFRLQKQIYLFISGLSFALFSGNHRVVDLLECWVFWKFPLSFERILEFWGNFLENVGKLRSLYKCTNLPLCALKW